MGILKNFRRAVDALERLAATQAQAVKSQPSERRLEELEQLVARLELERARWEAEMDGVLMKAEGKLQAANNSESRTRTMKKAYEKELDPFDPDSEEIETAVPAGDVPTGQEEEMYGVRMGVAPRNSKALATRAKWLR